MFLRGASVELRPVSRDERDALAHTPWLAHEGNEDILLSIALPGSPPSGLLAVRAIDWVARTAGLVAWWRDVPTAPAATVAQDALRAAVAYAFDELNLDEVHTRPLTADATNMLRRLGAEETNADQSGRLTLRRARRG